jgi:hypothetical protein
VVLGNVVLTTYLKQLGACEHLDDKKLKRIIEDNSINALKTIANDLRAETGIEIDLQLPLGRNGTPKSKPSRC